MKTPISYYGGKQNLVKEILPLIPEHKIYIEPFFGGGAVFFAKKPSEIEVINDINHHVINFYKVLQQNFDALKAEIDCTLHSRTQHAEAAEVYKNPENYSDIKRAWAFWVQTNMSFGNNPLAGWAFSRYRKQAKDTFTRKQRFNAEFSKRFVNVFIECNDAKNTITNFDDSEAFIYVDPPYVSSEQGHYAGYTDEDFKDLLDLLVNVKGKFLLSSYPEDVLMEYRQRFEWHTKDIQQTISVDGRRKKRKTKIECLTMNYKPNLSLSLFDVYEQYQAQDARPDLTTD